MLVASKKDKSRRLQKWVAGAIRDIFPRLSIDDVKSTSMGVTGADVQLSSEAKKCFPYQVECKAREDIKGLYKMYQQAYDHGDLEPLVFVRSNHKKTLVVLDAQHFFELFEKSLRSP